MAKFFRAIINKYDPNMVRKFVNVIGLTVLIPLLVTYYLSAYFTAFSFYTKWLVAAITAVIGILGTVYLFSFISLLTRLYQALSTVADGNFNRKVEVAASSGTESLASSINKVSQRLRESADELEKRSILVERSTQEMKRMDEIKLRYLANVAHELRAPLINIAKGSSFLREHNNYMDIGKMEKFLRIINDNAKRLIRLVNDLLDISKMEAGELSVRYELFDVNEIIQKAVSSLDGWRQSKELKLELKIASDLPKVYADKDRITQVIINLLSNAIKFTPSKGKIIVEAKTLANHSEAAFLKNKEKHFLMISVKDTGVGISASQKSTLFVRYRLQQEVSSYRTLPSTGLGLPIAKQIVEMHGGDIWVESQPGYGSRFVFTIPAGLKREMKPPVASSQVSGAEKRILIIDDEKNVRELLSQVLGKKGYVVSTARDGLEGLQKALEYCYDLVIADIRMPNIDGISCVKILKKVNPSGFFIFITGFPVEQELGEILKINSYPCIRKPFDLQEFLRTVEEACSVSV